jgi:hypothetical protein
MAMHCKHLFVLAKQMYRTKSTGIKPTRDRETTIAFIKQLATNKTTVEQSPLMPIGI